MIYTNYVLNCLSSNVKNAFLPRPSHREILISLLNGGATQKWLLLWHICTSNEAPISVSSMSTKSKTSKEASILHFGLPLGELLIELCTKAARNKITIFACNVHEFVTSQHLFNLFHDE